MELKKLLSEFRGSKQNHNNEQSMKELTQANQALVILFQLVELQTLKV